MRRISSDRLEMEIVRSPRLVLMVVDQDSASEDASSAEERAVVEHLQKLAATHALTTAFRLIVSPRNQDMRLLGVDRVPAVVACIDGRVVARATQLEQFRGSAPDRDTGTVEVAERLEPWLEHARVIGHGDGGGRRRWREGGGGDTSSGEDDIFEDAELPCCGKAGCTKDFYHVHVGLAGVGIDAQLLSVTD